MQKQQAQTGLQGEDWVIVDSPALVAVPISLDARLAEDDTVARPSEDGVIVDGTALVQVPAVARPIPESEDGDSPVKSQKCQKSRKAQSGVPTIDHEDAPGDSLQVCV